MSKTCLYDILGCERDASPKDLKKAYRKLALKHHPDKNAHRLEEATRQFRLVQQAYEVLKDPQEREWYDGHREQILRGDSSQDGEDSKTGLDPFELDLYKYRTCGVFDNDAEFYATYGNIFEKIDAIEKKMSGRRKEEEKRQGDRRRKGRRGDSDDESNGSNAPSFGSETSEWKHVEMFYKYWRSFVSKRPFAWCDKYKPSDAPDRRTRRLIEKENKSARSRGKKKFSSEVRSLCSFVHRRDPRVKARKAKLARERELEEIEEVRRKEEAKRLEAREREEADREWEAALARGEVEEIVVEETVWRCEWCNKTFRSERSHAQHVRSKKHKKRVAELTKRRGGADVVVGGGDASRTSRTLGGSSNDNAAFATAAAPDDDALLEEMLKMDLEEEEERRRRSRQSEDAKDVGDERTETLEKKGPPDDEDDDDEPKGDAEEEKEAASEKKKEAEEEEDMEEEEAEVNEQGGRNAFGALMYSSSSGESSDEEDE